jgi:antitoxin HigA-1
MHRGQNLAEELTELSRSAAALARHLKVPTNRITQILNGSRDASADTALRLAHFFGTSAEFWINLQSFYDLHIAPQTNGKAIKALADATADDRGPRIERVFTTREAVAARNLA